MAEPLFPVRSPHAEPPASVLSIEPYRHDGAWVFDDLRVGLVSEPFVAGITEMIDRLVVGIPSAVDGFRLQFSDHPFEEHQASLAWVRVDPVEGHWYRSEDSGEEGWLCPALFWYFPSAPPRIYVRAEEKK